MKIRSGFVSNSSTSSFIICDAVSLEEVRERIDIVIDAFNKVFGESLENRKYPISFFFKNATTGLIYENKTKLYK